MRTPTNLNTFSDSERETVIVSKVNPFKIILCLLAIVGFTIIFFNISNGFHNDIIFGIKVYKYGNRKLGTIEDGPVIHGEYNFIAFSNEKSKNSENSEENNRELITGTIKRLSDGTYEVEVAKNPIIVKSSKNDNFEDSFEPHFSGLNIFDGKLYTCCEKTGIVYEIISLSTENNENIEINFEEDLNVETNKKDSSSNVLIPRHILADGDGYNLGVFRSQWMTAKDKEIFVGASGMETKRRINTGEIVEYGSMYVKRIQKSRVIHEDWKRIFKRIRLFYSKSEFSSNYNDQEVEIFFHSVEYNENLKLWFFLPNRITRDNVIHPSNLFFSVSDDFSIIKTKQIKFKENLGTGKEEENVINSERGFTGMKFIPGRNEFVALRTSLDNENKKTFLTVVNINGDVLLEESVIADENLEGIVIMKKRYYDDDDTV